MKTSYVFIDLPVNQKDRLICQLTEVYCQHKKKILIYSGSNAAARQLDQLLWTFKQESFLPHGLWPGSDFDDNPVLITSEAEQWPAADVVILETRLPLKKITGWRQVIDFTDAFDPDLLEISRARYKECLSDLGIEVSHFKINDFIASGLNAGLSG
jgi:DNA polymerase-3 subunit chi